MPVLINSIEHNPFHYGPTTGSTTFRFTITRHFYRDAWKYDQIVRSLFSIKQILQKDSARSIFSKIVQFQSHEKIVPRF